MLTAAKGGDAPHLAVILSTDRYTLIDEGVVEPLDELVKIPDERALMNRLRAGFTKNSQTGGKTWGFPYWLFQGFTTQNGVELMNAAGTQTSCDRPGAASSTAERCCLSGHWRMTLPCSIWPSNQRYPGSLAGNGKTSTSRGVPLLGDSRIEELADSS